MKIGAFRIYNDIGLNKETIGDLRDVAKTAKDIGASNMGALLQYVLFSILQNQASDPIAHFFEALANKFYQDHTNNISEGTRVTLSEGGAASIELKSAEWFYVDDDRILVEKLTEEFGNGAGLVIGGVDENGGKAKTIQKNRFPHERLNGLQKRVEQRLDAEQVHVIPVPVDGGDLIITALKTGV